MELLKDTSLLRVVQVIVLVTVMPMEQSQGSHNSLLPVVEQAQVPGMQMVLHRLGKSLEMEHLQESHNS